LVYAPRSSKDLKVTADHIKESVNAERLSLLNAAVESLSKIHRLRKEKEKEKRSNVLEIISSLFITC